MMQFLLSAIFILGFLGLLSIILLVAGVTALFDGSPLWFGLLGIALGGFGLISTRYHMSMAWSFYMKLKASEDNGNGTSQQRNPRH